MDEIDCRVVNLLQDGMPVCERPFAALAAELGLGEDDVIDRVRRLRENGFLSRFGPMFDVARIGGEFTLCAMHVPAPDFDRVADLVNAHPEVAHNYERDHELNMWFVLATERPEATARTIRAIEAETGLAVLDLPKLEEYYVGLRLEARSLVDAPSDTGGMARRTRVAAPYPTIRHDTRSKER